MHPNQTKPQQPIPTPAAALITRLKQYGWKQQMSTRESCEFWAPPSSRHPGDQAIAIPTNPDLEDYEYLLERATRMVNGVLPPMPDVLSELLVSLKELVAAADALPVLPGVNPRLIDPEVIERAHQAIARAEGTTDE